MDSRLASALLSGNSITFLYLFLISCISLASEPSRILMDNNGENPNVGGIQNQAALWGAIEQIQASLRTLTTTVAELSNRVGNNTTNTPGGAHAVATGDIPSGTGVATWACLTPTWRHRRRPHRGCFWQQHGGSSGRQLLSNYPT